MTDTHKVHADQSQSDKFKQAARELECDQDEARWDKRLKKVVEQKLEEKKPAD